MTTHAVADGVRRNFERISRWMNAHGAPLLPENLAPGATAETLARAERAFGVALPADLRALWSLHDGQREERNGYVEHYDLLSVAAAIAEQETVLAGVESRRRASPDRWWRRWVRPFAPESPDWWKDSGATAEEIHSDHWLPFAGRDSDLLAVHGVSGRVFRCDHDDSFRRLAPSLGAWLEGYADRVEADDYRVEKGFGAYYLVLRDRKAERAEQERAARRAEHERMRRETPLLAQMRDAVARNDEDRCVEVLKDAFGRADKTAFNAAVALLFGLDAEPGRPPNASGDPAPTLVAGALRSFLKALTLTPDQWLEVAIGGALLGNNAVRDTAVARATGFSQARLDRLVKATAAGLPGGDRDALEALLQKLRSKGAPGAPS